MIPNTRLPKRRSKRLSQLPHAVMLELSFPEVDCANRWCWQSFGPSHGECYEARSEYRSCLLDGPHCHIGTWSYHFFVKTDYDFGFCEWYFAERSQLDRLVENFPAINWGKHYPK